MKIKILSLVILVIAIGLFGGVGTLAWFVSQTSSGGNTFNVGSFEISETQYGEIPTPLFSTSYSNSTWDQLYAVGLWYPGKIVSGNDRSLSINNTGSLQAVIYGVSAEMKDFIVPENSSYDEAKEEFTEKMIITVKMAGKVYYQGSLKDLLNAVQPLQDPIIVDPDPQFPISLDFEAELSTSAGNDAQGVEASVDLIIHATQNQELAIQDLLDQ